MKKQNNNFTLFSCIPQKSSGFTLSELIVVISILAILGMIAFVSYGKYIQSAKNSSIITTTQVLSKALAFTNAKQGVSYRTYIQHDPKTTVTGFVGGGSAYLNPGSLGDSETNYSAGVLGSNMASVLKLSSSAMKDEKGNNFIIGAVDYTDRSSSTPRYVQSYQVFGTIAQDDADVTTVQGNYVKKIAEDADGLVHAYGSASGSALQNTVSVPYQYLPSTQPTANPWLMTIGGEPPVENTLNGLSAQFTFMNGMAIDPLGNIYVADVGANKIKKYNSIGNYLMTIGGGASDTGNGTGASFNWASGVAIDSLGSIYVADRFNNKIKKYTSTGAYILTIGGGASQTGNGTSANISMSEDIAVDANNNLYIADSQNNKVKKYTSTGVYLMTIGSSFGDNTLNGTSAMFKYPNAVTVDNSGSIFVSDSNVPKVKKYTSTGAYILTIGGGVSDTGNGTSAELIGPSGISTDRFNNVYISDPSNHKIKKYTSTGVYLMAIGNRQGDNNLNGTLARLSGPEGISIDTSGNIFIIDSGNKKVRKYNSNGEYLMTIGSSSYNILNGTSAYLNPAGIAVDPSGNIFAADSIGNNIKKYSSSGTYLMTLGDIVTGDTNLNGVDAQFSAPRGVSLDTSGNIYISDTSNNKIKKYTSTGVHLMTIGGGADDVGSGINAELYNPTGVAIDSSGNIYTSTLWFSQKMKKYTSTGVYLMTIGGGADPTGDGINADLGGLTGIALDSAGNIYVIDSYNNKMNKYGPAGNYLMTIGGGADDLGNGVNAELLGVSGVVLDSSNNIYITAGSKIKKYASNGNYISTLGNSAAGDNTLGGVNAQFNGINGIAIDTLGSIYVADMIKIKKYGP